MPATPSDYLTSVPFDTGFNHGMRHDQVFDPHYSWNSEQKDEYRQGFTAARDFRIEGKREFTFNGQTYTIGHDRPKMRTIPITPEQESRIDHSPYDKEYARQFWHRYIDASAAFGQHIAPSSELWMLENSFRLAYGMMSEAELRTFRKSSSYEEVLEWLSKDSFGRSELGNLVAAAQQHGEDSDPDHTCGDLQDLLRECLFAMKPVTRAKFCENPQIMEQIERGESYASSAPTP